MERPKIQLLSREFSLITETQKAKSAIKRVQCQACLSIVERKQIIQLLEVLAHSEEI